MDDGIVYFGSRQLFSITRQAHLLPATDALSPVGDTMEQFGDERLVSDAVALGLGFDGF